MPIEIDQEAYKMLTKKGYGCKLVVYMSDRPSKLASPKPNIIT
jgi:hypothetical protein